jgi:hypothetical protein
VTFLHFFLTATRQIHFKLWTLNLGIWRRTFLDIIGNDRTHRLLYRSLSAFDASTLSYHPRSAGIPSFITDTECVINALIFRFNQQPLQLAVYQGMLWPYSSFNRFELGGRTNLTNGWTYNPLQLGHQGIVDHSGRVISSFDRFELEEELTNLTKGLPVSKRNSYDYNNSCTAIISLRSRALSHVYLHLFNRFELRVQAYLINGRIELLCLNVVPILPFVNWGGYSYTVFTKGGPWSMCICIFLIDLN